MSLHQEDLFLARWRSMKFKFFGMERSAIFSTKEEKRHFNIRKEENVI
jgi:hypothetical protein